MIQLEKQLQWKELIRKQDVVSKETASSGPILIVPKSLPALSEEKQIAFRQRLEEAKRKAAEVTLRRNEEEAKILKSWNQEKMKKVVGEMQKKDTSKVILLPSPREESAEFLNTAFQSLVDMAHMKPSLQDELSSLQEMLHERDSLGKLFNEAQEQEAEARAEVRKLRGSLASVNSMKINLCGNINLSNTVINTVKNLESQKRNLNLYVYRPNPIFNITKELELTYSVNNQFIIEMLKELDISLHVVQQNLSKAQETRRKFKESKTRIMEALQSVQDNIDTQTKHLNNLQQAIKPVNTFVPDILPLLSDWPRDHMGSHECPMNTPGYPIENPKNAP